MFKQMALITALLTFSTASIANACIELLKNDRKLELEMIEHVKSDLSSQVNDFFKAHNTDVKIFFGQADNYDFLRYYMLELKAEVFTDRSEMSLRSHGYKETNKRNGIHVIGKTQRDFEGFPTNCQFEFGMFELHNKTTNFTVKLLRPSSIQISL